jgi:hypothetical protein
MSSIVRARKHAGGLYAQAFRRLRHPIQRIEAEAHHLREVEQSGESGETPAIAIAGLLLFLLPLAALFMILAFGAAWLFG